MQHLFSRIVSLLVCSCFCLVAAAQKVSTIVKDNSGNEYSEHKKSLSHVKKDSLPPHNRLFYLQQDSIRNHSRHIKMDSLKHAEKAAWIAYGSAEHKRHLAMLDSLHKINWLRNSKRLAQRKMTLSQMRKLKQLNRMDSIQLKQYLQQLKKNIQSSIKNPAKQKNLHQWEATMETKMNKSNAVFIDNIGRDLVIKTQPGNNLRVKTLVRYTTDPGTDRQEIDKIELEFKTTDSMIRIQPKPVTRLFQNTPGAYPYKDIRSTGKMHLQEQQHQLGDDDISITTVFVPVGVQVYVTSSYDVAIDNDLVFLQAAISNSALTMRNADHAVITSKYCIVKAGNIKTAILSLFNSNFIADNITKLTIKSINSTVKFDRSDKIFLNSTSDHYQIAAVNNLQGNKDFGKLNIEQLKNNMVITGSGSDLEIGAVDAEAGLIQIDNKYANVKIPLNTLQSYTVNFDGKNSKVYTTFEQHPAVKPGSVKSSTVNFAASVGDVSKAHTKLQINCNSCTVDLKQ